MTRRATSDWETSTSFTDVGPGGSSSFSYDGDDDASQEAIPTRPLLVMPVLLVRKKRAPTTSTAHVLGSVARAAVAEIRGLIGGGVRITLPSGAVIHMHQRDIMSTVSHPDGRVTARVHGCDNKVYRFDCNGDPLP